MFAMTSTSFSADIGSAFPDHTQLPDSDGTFVKNFQEHPQSILLIEFWIEIPVDAAVPIHA